MGEHKRRAAELRTTIVRDAAATGVTDPSEGDVQRAYAFIRDELLAKHGITQEHDINVADRAGNDREATAGSAHRYTFSNPAQLKNWRPSGKFAGYQKAR